MNKLFTKIVGTCLGLTMAVGAGVAIANNSEAIMAKADSSYSHQFTYSEKGTGSGKTWDGTNLEDASTYWKSSSSADSVATVSGLFTGKTITSAVTITLDVACFGTGSNPTASKFSIYTSSACTKQATATQSGTLPSSSSYTAPVYTVTLANASNFSDDLSIKIASGTKQIRFRSFTVAFSYTESSLSVTYNNNQTYMTSQGAGTISGTVPTDATPYSNGASVTVKGNTGNLALTNYSFNGWNTSADGTGTAQAVGSTFTISANTTLYAQWLDTRSYYDITTSSDYLILSGDTHVLEGEAAEITITADAKWKVPTSITVTGAGTQGENWSYSAGVLTILEVTGNVTVSGTAVAAEVLGIEVTVDPSETSFYLGHTFTHSTAVVTATYDDAAGTEEDVTSGCIWSSPDMFTTGNSKTVTVTHTASGETDTYTISVSTKTTRGASVTKVTSSRDDWSGTYVIVSDDHMLGTTVSSNRIDNVDLPTISGSNITSEVTNDMKWTITKVTGGYTIKNVGTNAYLASTGTKNQAALPTTSTDSKTVWTIAYSGGFTITNKNNSDSSVNAVLRNNDTYGWACYGDSTGNAPQLYECLDAITKDLIKITASATSATRYIGDSVTTSDFTVTAYYDDGTSVSVTATSVTNATLESASNTVTVNYTESGITKSIDVIVTAEERDDVLLSIEWDQDDVYYLIGDKLDISGLSSFTAYYDADDDGEADSSASKAPSVGTVSLYSDNSGSKTKVRDIADEHEWIASEDGLYLGVTYEENSVSKTAYAGQVFLVEELNPINPKTPASLNETFTASENGWTSGSEVNSWTGTNFSFSITDGTNNNPKYYSSGNGTLRVYSGSVITITSSKNITAIQFTFATAGTMTADPGTWSSPNWSGSTSSIAFTVSANTQIEKIKITYDGIVVGDDIANTNLPVQKQLLLFVSYFNTELDKVCNDNGSDGISTTWTDLASKYATYRTASGNSTVFDNLIKNADATERAGDGSASTGDSLQNALARYDWIVAHHTGLTDFINTTSGRDAVQASARVVPFANVINGANGSAIIIIISLIGLTAIGGYFFFRRRKEY